MTISKKLFVVVSTLTSIMMSNLYASNSQNTLTQINDMETLSSSINNTQAYISAHTGNSLAQNLLAQNLLAQNFQTWQNNSPTERNASLRDGLDTSFILVPVDELDTSINQNKLEQNQSDGNVLLNKKTRRPKNPETDYYPEVRNQRETTKKEYNKLGLRSLDEYGYKKIGCLDIKQLPRYYKLDVLDASMASNIYDSNHLTMCKNNGPIQRKNFVGRKFDKFIYRFLDAKGNTFDLVKLLDLKTLNDISKGVLYTAYHGKRRTSAKEATNMTRVYANPDTKFRNDDGTIVRKPDIVKLLEWTVGGKANQVKGIFYKAFVNSMSKHLKKHHLNEQIMFEPCFKAVKNLIGTIDELLIPLMLYNEIKYPETLFREYVDVCKSIGIINNKNENLNGDDYAIIITDWSLTESAEETLTTTESGKKNLTTEDKDSILQYLYNSATEWILFFLNNLPCESSELCKNLTDKLQNANIQGNILVTPKKGETEASGSSILIKVLDECWHTDAFQHIPWFTCTDKNTSLSLSDYYDSCLKEKIKHTLKNEDLNYFAYHNIFWAATYDTGIYWFGKRLPCFKLIRAKQKTSKEKSNNWLNAYVFK